MRCTCHLTQPALRCRSRRSASSACELRRWVAAVRVLKIVGGLVALRIALYLADDLWPQYFAQSIPAADEILVSKSDRELVLLVNGQPIKTYSISLGGNPLGHKTEEGDEKTPEGVYSIDWRNENSRYYRSLHISYPNLADKAQAAARNVSPGGAIMIHGSPNGLGLFAWALAPFNWTDGCIAVSNPEMAEIWAAVPDGTPIRIVP